MKEKESEREGGRGDTGGLLHTHMVFCGISVNGQGNERCGGIIVIDGH